MAERISNRHNHLETPQTSIMPSDSSVVAKPKFADLQKNAESSRGRKILAGYFIPRNYGRSIQWHERLGTSRVRRVVMSRTGSLPGKENQLNYRLDRSKSKIEAATDFALAGSIRNEVVHTAFAVPSSSLALLCLAEGRYSFAAAISALFAVPQIALVALQRYNRARMVQKIDKELQIGGTYSSTYRNKFGIDARAVANYHARNS